MSEGRATESGLWKTAFGIYWRSGCRKKWKNRWPELRELGPNTPMAGAVLYWSPGDPWQPERCSVFPPGTCFVMPSWGRLTLMSKDIWKAIWNTKLRRGQTCIWMQKESVFAPKNKGKMTLEVNKGSWYMFCGANETLLLMNSLCLEYKA